MRCIIKENESMTLRKFCKCLNDDFKKKIMLIGVTLNQAYIVLQDYEMLIKSK